MNVPNLITMGRIVLAVVLIPLLFVDTFQARIAAFVIFLVAAFSDLWDGHLARRHGLITDLGKLLDPIADKLLLAATFVPFYLLSHGADAEAYPWFGGVLPFWIVAVIFGRELFITAFRSYAARRGVILPAGAAGKYKAVTQNFSIGAAVLWYALQSRSREAGWSGEIWSGWQRFHFGFNVVALTVAVVLTVYSLVVYLRGFRRLNLTPGAPPPRD